MHHFIYNFSRYIFSILIVILIFACDDIPRDNLLDPKNPNSYRPKIISIEAFVNTQNDDVFNENMLSALDIIGKRYAGKVLISHYHRSVGDTYPDSLEFSGNETLYTQYVTNFDDQKGVPDVFINGSAERIKGASSIASALERLDNALQPMLVENSFYTIEPKFSVRGSSLVISAVIARLGSESDEDILVRAVLVDKNASQPDYPVVRQMDTSNLIPIIEPGEQKEIKFSDFIYDQESDLSLIFIISSNKNQLINQAVEVSIP